jgi:hypothetical protein
MPNLQIVVFHDKLHEPVQRMPALLWGEPIDLLYMVTDRKDRLPTSHWIRANYGVLSSQVCAYILRRTSWLAVELEAIFLCRCVEIRLRVCSRQAFKEFLIRLG